jgi:glucose-1-phosphate thymidylyltransferase
MKGIILAGGTGSRLWPVTIGVSKQLLPVYDKPLIYYPLSTLMSAGIRDILVITTPEDALAFERVLGDGSQFGISISYAIQTKPEGLAQAFLIGESFIGSEPCALVLGDNIFHGVGLGRDLIHELPSSGAHIFTYEVSNPSDYGILEIDHTGKPISIIEKPSQYISNMAVTGVYFFDGKVSSIAKEVKPSARGELEITSVIDHYLKADTLTFTQLSRGSTWLDTGNPDSLNNAAAYVKIIEDRTGLKIACLEEISFAQAWISPAQLQLRINQYKMNSYAKYLQRLIS